MHGFGPGFGSKFLQDPKNSFHTCFVPKPGTSYTEMIGYLFAKKVLHTIKCTRAQMNAAKESGACIQIYIPLHSLIVTIQPCTLTLHSNTSLLTDDQLYFPSVSIVLIFIIRLGLLRLQNGWIGSILIPS